MERFVAALFAVAIFGPYACISAVAQQSPSEQALGAKLFQEINASLACNASLIDLQRQLADARKQIEELKKPKDEPK